MSTATWLDYTPCLDLDYFNQTTLGQSFQKLTTSTSSSNSSSSNNTTSKDTFPSTTSTTSTTSHHRPSVLATKLLQKIGQRVLNGEDGHDTDDEDNNSSTKARRPRSHSQAGAPISVSQVLREIRRVAASASASASPSASPSHTLQVPPPAPAEETKPTYSTPAHTLLHLLVHPTFCPPVGELGLSFLQQGLLVPEDWDVVVEHVQRRLAESDPITSPENDDENDNNNNNNNNNNKTAGSSVAASAFLTLGRPSTSSNPFARRRVEDENEKQQEMETETEMEMEMEIAGGEDEEDRLRRIIREQGFDAPVGRGGGAARLYDIFGHKRKKTVTVQMMRPSEVKRKQNQHYVCLDFCTRRSMRTSSTAVASQMIDGAGPLLMHHSISVGGAAASFSQSTSSSFSPALSSSSSSSSWSSSSSPALARHHHLTPLKGTNTNTQDIPVGSLSSLGSRSRAATMFHYRNYPVRQRDDGSGEWDQHQQGEGGGERKVGEGEEGEKGGEGGEGGEAQLDSGGSQVNPQQLNEFHLMASSSASSSRRLSPLVAQPSSSLPQHHPQHHQHSSPALQLAPPQQSLKTIGWFFHSIEIKPNNLQFGKMVRNTTSLNLSVRLQNVGITTKRFRIYSQHPDIICSNTTPAGKEKTNY